MSKEIIPVREFYENTFNLDFLSEEEKETIYKATELYAQGVLRNTQLHEDKVNGKILEVD